MPDLRLARAGHGVGSEGGEVTAYLLLGCCLIFGALALVLALHDDKDNDPDDEGMGMS